MTRTPIVGGNWKMNLSLSQAQRLAAELRNQLGSQRAAHVVVLPPSPFLAPVAQKLSDSAVWVGAQDVHAEASGAYTSGVAAPMVASLGAGWTLVGHSERRAYFGDSDARVGDKLGAALSAGLRVILCVGESLDERRADRTFEVVTRQLDAALGGRSAGALASLVIAYEPVWAIGTGLTATPAQAQEAHAFIRGHLSSRLGPAFAQALRIQYGGSVKPDNAAAIIAQPDVDGALVGGASLDAAAFVRIVRACGRVS